MKQLLKSLARRFLGVCSSVPLGFIAVPVVAEWTADDARQWKTFLQSPAGQSLWKRARAREAALCVQACGGQFDTKVAGGFSYTLNWFESLANPEIISTTEVAKSETIEAGTHEDAGFSPETSFA
jgi:hypothetical protein